MTSSLKDLFRADINSAINNWEQLLVSLAQQAGFEENALSKVRQKTFEQIKEQQHWSQVVGVSDLYAKNIATSITETLSSMYPSLTAVIEVDDRQKSHLAIRYNCDEGLWASRIDTLADFNNFIELTSFNADYNNLLQQIQESDEFPDTTEGLLGLLKISGYKYVLDSTKVIDKAVKAILDTQSFYSLDGDVTLPSNILKAISSALLVKGLLKEQLRQLDIADVNLTITMNGLQPTLVARKDGDYGFEITVLEIEDFGDVINLAR